MSDDTNVVLHGRRRQLTVAHANKEMRRSFVDPVTPAQVKAYIETILLLATLMFAFAASYLCSFSYDDLTAADARWIALCRNKA